MFEHPALDQQSVSQSIRRAQAVGSVRSVNGPESSDTMTVSRQVRSHCLEPSLTTIQLSDARRSVSKMQRHRKGDMGHSRKVLSRMRNSLLSRRSRYGNSSKIIRFLSRMKVLCLEDNERAKLQHNHLGVRNATPLAMLSAGRRDRRGDSSRGCCSHIGGFPLAHQKTGIKASRRYPGRHTMKVKYDRLDYGPMYYRSTYSKLKHRVANAN
ncbi:hypothetical protein BDV18DRAFT_130504 [Aspergillus unguis]